VRAQATRASQSRIGTNRHLPFVFRTSGNCEALDRTACASAKQAKEPCPLSSFIAGGRLLGFLQERTLQGFFRAISEKRNPP